MFTTSVTALEFTSEYSNFGKTFPCLLSKFTKERKIDKIRDSPEVCTSLFLICDKNDSIYNVQCIYHSTGAEKKNPTTFFLVLSTYFIFRYCRVHKLTHLKVTVIIFVVIKVINCTSMVYSWPTVLLLKYHRHMK